MDEPRIAPIDGEVEGVPNLNIFRTMVRHPKLADRFNRFGGYFLYKSTLPAREREVVILRTGWRSEAVYEFGQHTVIGRNAGMTDEEIARLATEGTDGWAEGDRDLIDLVDELCATNDVSDGTWARLTARWDEADMIELVLLAGFYRLVSGFLNALRVQLEPGTPGWPAPGGGGGEAQ